MYPYDIMFFRYIADLVALNCDNFKDLPASFKFTDSSDTISFLDIKIKLDNTFSCKVF